MVVDGYCNVGGYGVVFGDVSVSVVVGYCVWVDGVWSDWVYFKCFFWYFFVILSCLSSFVFVIILIV